MHSALNLPEETLEQALDFDALEAAFLSTSAQSMRAECRRVIAQAYERFKQRFFSGAAPDEIVRLRAAVIDEIVLRAWRHWMPADSPHALLAVGGYGRGELLPYSDVDLGLLLAGPLSGDEQSAVECFITFLWDIGLEVGHSVRSVEESAGAAAADITIMTSLLEARLLAGPESLLATLQAAIGTDRLWPVDAFFNAKVEEQALRHERYHDAFQQLEPNIKESPGGLRDIQTVAWVASRHFKTAGLQGLVEHGFLTAAEYRALVRGRNHLWQIRCALHFLAGRREDRLLFDYQRRVSEVFGFVDESHNRAVEQFMRGFYRTVRELGRMNEMLLGLFREAIVEQDQAIHATPLNRRFQLRGNYIEVTHDQVFKRTPPALLEIFLLIQRQPGIKGVRASTIRLIRESLPLIDDKFRADIRARSLFMEIIRQPRRIGHELQRMHRYGVLAAYLPEFARIEGLMQFDLFHVYTVDEHLLFVVLTMRRFSYPLQSDDQPALVREVIERIPKLELLYLAGLYHDVGKGSGRDHSDLGSEEAAAFCLGHGLSAYDTALVAWLVSNHLVMSSTSQRQDIYDPLVLQQFAQVVGNQTRLDYLFLLTIADIRGTNPQLWTSWKRTLIFDLYAGTRRALQSRSEAPRMRSERAAENRGTALALLAAEGVEEATVAPLWETLTEEYFQRHRPVELAWHAAAILATRPDELPLVEVNTFEGVGGTSVFIYAKDMDFLFAIAAATLDRLRLDVQDARIITSRAGYTLDTFIVLEAETRALVTDPDRIQELRRRLGSALQSGQIPTTRTAPAQSRRLRNFSVEPKVEFSPPDSLGRTMMEFVAADRPGLLSLVGRAMQQQGIRLHDARISTIGEKVEDFFYVTDIDNHPLEDAGRREALRSAILAALSDAT